ncbi:thermonuclease family protein [Arenibaculum sp.]|jgi:endonuclease YncB( thermonuclease family)|uniref:thermonuclease family protein n=1 Tax=Arenibaculum sp. TaxID=2865862 RepID=UPI002E15AB4C|nr:thermonuclease family protein [Arenibaculum sp.]
MSALLALSLFATPVSATGTTEALVGAATVIDGDTLEIRGQRIRLHGIDAPEAAQTCTDAAGKAWRCGQRAALELAERIGRATVTCEQKDRDRYGRIVAVCSTGNRDLNAWMTESGWALAYRAYSRDYADAEAAARSARAGIWAGTFDAPWDWRRERRSGGQATVAAGTTTGPATDECPIKGNVGSRGARIYHVPGNQFYEATVIDEHKGERWFCSEAEATAAGWRKARR